MRKIIGALLGALLLGGVLAAPAAAYPGADGYDSGYCWSNGVKMGVSNWKSGTGQMVAVDVDDHSGFANLSRVQWSSSIWTGTFTTSLARKEVYRPSLTEAPWLTLYDNRGGSCSLKLDGSMMS